MLIYFCKRILVLLFLIQGFHQAHGQIRPVLIADADLTYENGILTGLGLGIRSPQWEIMPSVLLGEGRGAKLELRWYPTLGGKDRIQPYLAFKQVVFRQINTCVNNSCPFVLYQALPGVGTNIRIWKGFQFNLGMACGLKNESRYTYLETDFSLGLGVRYEF